MALGRGGLRLLAEKGATGSIAACGSQFIGDDELHHKERDADVCIVLSDEILFVGINDNYLRRSGRSDCVM